MQVLASIQTQELIQKTEFAIAFHTDFAAGSEDIRINDLPQAVSETQALLDELATSLVYLNVFRLYFFGSVFENSELAGTSPDKTSDNEVELWVVEEVELLGVIQAVGARAVVEFPIEDQKGFEASGVSPLVVDLKQRKLGPRPAQPRIRGKERVD